MTAVTDALAAELHDATEQADQAGQDPIKVLAALDRFAALIVALDNARLTASAETKKLIDQALVLHTDPRDLYGRPFSDTYVRERYAALRKTHKDLPKPPRGPRPRRLPGAVA